MGCWKPSPSRVEDFSQFLKNTGLDDPQCPSCHGESINVERCYQISIPTVNGNVEKSHKCTLQTVIQHDKFERRRGGLREKHGTNLAMPILRSTPEKAAARKKREMRVPCVAGPSGVAPVLPRNHPAQGHSLTVPWFDTAHDRRQSPVRGNDPAPQRAADRAAGLPDPSRFLAYLSAYTRAAAQGKAATTLQVTSRSSHLTPSALVTHKHRLAAQWFASRRKVEWIPPAEICGGDS